MDDVNIASVTLDNVETLEVRTSDGSNAGASMIDLDGAAELTTIEIEELNDTAPGARNSQNVTFDNVTQSMTSLVFDLSNFTDGNDDTFAFANVVVDYDTAPDTLDVSFNNDGVELTKGGVVSVADLDVSDVTDMTIDAKDGAEPNSDGAGGFEVRTIANSDDLETVSVSADSQFLFGTDGGADGIDLTDIVAFADGIKSIDGSDVSGPFGASAAKNTGNDAAGVSITGGDGADVLITGAGEDEVDGGAGADTIYVLNNAQTGVDVDELTGGEGSDTFVISGTLDDGSDVEDFTAGSGGDIIDFDDDNVFADGSAGSLAADPDTTIDLTAFDENTVAASGGAVTADSGFEVVVDSGGNTASGLSVGNVATFLGDVDGAAGSSFTSSDGLDHAYPLNAHTHNM